MVPRLSGHKRLIGHLALVVAVAGLWSALARRPLWHTDLWGHLAYGRWMIEHGGATPTTEPFLTHASDRPLVDTARWSQLIAFRLMRAGGVEALQLIYATLVVGCALLTVSPVLASRHRQRIPAAICGASVFLAVGWQQLLIIRPQLAGLACFVGLLALLHDPRPSIRRVIVVGIVMGLWANLHGSFVIGWLLLGSHAVGRAADRFRRTGRWPAWKSDRVFAHRLRQAAVGLLVPLVATPYGPGLPLSIWQIGQHPNLADIIEWQPLQWHQSQARAMLAGIVLVVCVAMSGRRRVRFSNWLMLVALGVATLSCSRMINWWAPVAGLVLALQAASISTKRPVATTLASSERRTVLLASLVVAGVAMSSTPAVRGLLTERETLQARRPMVSASTPVEVTRWLASHPPGGMVLASYEWSDFLLWQGPSQIRLLVTSHAHLVPTEAWTDYFEVIGVASDWRQRLRRYDIRTVVLDRHRQGKLLAALATDPGWQQDYSDALAEVWSRKP